MNKDYFKSIPRPKDLINQASDSFKQPINQQMQRLKSDYSVANLLMLQKLLHSQKSCKEISEQQKDPIFRYILQQELRLRTFLHSRSTVALRILNLVKFRIKNLRIDWLEVYQTLRQQERQIARSKSSNLQQFLKIIRPFFDPNNAMDVVRKFAYGEAVNQENTYTYIELFSYVCSDTSDQIFQQYLRWIYQSYDRKNIQAGTFFLLFINCINKRKQAEVEQSFYKQFNTIVLTAIMNPPIKGIQNDSRFTKDNGAIIYFLVGKNNPLSLQLLDKVFTIVNKNILPFENSTRALQFFYSLIRWFWKRIQSQKHTRKKLAKLLEKQGRKNVQKDKEEEQEDQDQQDQEEQQEKQQANEQNLAKELLSIEEDEGANENDAIKKQRYERILKRQITEDIIQLLKKHVEIMFENAYFVNSKKTVPQLLRYIFMFFPEMCQKSLQLIDKAAKIPDINDDALTLNIKVTVQYLFTKGKQVFAVQNVMRILEKIYETRKIADVWNIYQLFYSKIPLLDEKDMNQVSEQEKQKFQNKFGLNHDRFYQAYSQNVFEAYKRLLRQGQYFDQSARRSQGQALSDLLYNCGPIYRKRLIQEAIEVIVDNQNQFAFVPLDIYNKPLPKKFQQILERQLESIKHSQSQEMIVMQQNIVSALFPSKSLKQIEPYIRSLAKKNRFNMIHDYMRVKITLDIDIQPLKSTLDYFETDPKLKLKEVLSIEQKQASLKQFHQYFDSLVKELAQLLEQPDMKGQTKEFVIQKLYKTQQALKIADKRRSVYEILNIISKMSRNFEDYLYVYQNDTPKLVEPQISPPNILSDKFLQIIRKIVYNSQMMEDAKIPAALTELIFSPINKYIEKIKNEKDIEKRAQAQNSHRQLPENKNTKFFIYTYISQIKVCQAAILFNKTRNDKRVQQIKDILIILLVAPQNQKIGQIISSLILENKINLFNQEIVQLFRLSNKLQNKFYQSRLTDILEILKNNGAVFQPQQTANLIEYHLNLSMHADNKLRDASLKSFRHLMKLTEEVDVHDAQSAIKIELKKYFSRSKLQILWVYSIYLLIYQKDKTKWQGVQLIQLAEGNFSPSKKQKNDFPAYDLKQRVESHLQNLESLIMSDSRLLRRISMFIYAAFHRKFRKQYNKYKQFAITDLQHKQKSVEDFLRTGYLYPQHQTMNIKNRRSKRRQPYSMVQVKQSPDFPSHTYNFLIQNPRKVEQFLQCFRDDMAATPEQLISQAQNLKALDISDVMSRLMEQTYSFMKLRTFKTSRIQMVFGTRFFKYLFYQDSNNEYKFFENSKAFMISCLEKLNSLDNQAALLIYTANLLMCYTNRFHIHGQHRGIQEFVQKVTQSFVFQQGNVYKRFVQIVFSNIQDLRPIQFIVNFCEKMIKNRIKVSSHAQLLLSIKRHDRPKHMQIIKILLQERIELSNNFLSKLISMYVNISQKMPVNLKHATQTKVLNIQKLLKQGEIYKFSQNTYIIAKKQFQQYIIKKINYYIESSLTKQAYNFVNYVLKAYSKTIQTQQNIDMIATIMRIGFKLINTKGEFQIDHKVFEENLKGIFNQSFEKNYFEGFLSIIIEQIQPTKKCLQIVQMIAQRPRNFLLIDQVVYQQFIMKIIKTQQNSIIFRQTLAVLVNLVRNRNIDIENMKLEKSQKVLMYQAYLLGNMKLEKQKIQFILKFSNKDKRSIWAKEMVSMRGKRYFLDNEQQYQIWGQIKSISIPYNYIV